MSTPILKCHRNGCEKPVAASRVCDEHFLESYGITVEEYRKNKRWVAESPAKVAARMSQPRPPDEMVEQAAKDIKSIFPEVKEPVPETKVPVAETEQPENETKPPVGAAVLFIFVPCNEQLRRTIEQKAEEEFRTVEQQAAWYMHHGMKAMGL